MKRILPLLSLLTICLFFQANSLKAQSSLCEGFDIELKANGILCSESLGEIWIDIIGGKTGSYEVEWYSPQSRVGGKGTSLFEGYEISSLPKGTYTVKVTDFRTRCSVSKKIELKRGSVPQGLKLTGRPANCKGFGSLSVRIPGFKKPPFKIRLKGPQSEEYLVNNNNFSIYNLPVGDYEFSLIEDDCEATTTFNIPTAAGLPSFTLEDEADACNVSSGNIIMRIQDGTPGYTVTLDGPTSGTVNVSDPAFRIFDLISGDYKITLEDAKGCISFGFITIDRVGLAVNLMTKKATCSENGVIEVNISKGTAPYKVSYRGGGTEGNTTITGKSTSFSVPIGTYLVEVVDADGCKGFSDTVIEEKESDLYCSITPSATTCNEDNGSINVFISGGKKPYSLAYTGPVSGNVIVNGSVSFDNLPAGVYTTFLKDAEGCAVSESSAVIVGNSENAAVEFSYAASTTSVVFYNYTTTSGDFLWTFGDGNSSSEFSPSHKYEAAGTYEVCLSQSGVCSIDIKCQTLQIAAAKVNSGLSAPISTSFSALIAETEVANNLRVNQNSPNPFTQQTNILFELPEAGSTTIMIHDNTGKVVQTHTANYDKGSNLFTFNQNNLASGVYYYTIKAGKFNATKKMIIR